MMPAVNMERTPLPVKLLSSCLFVYLAESISLTVLFPFVAFMVRDFNVADSEEDLGIYVGTIETAFTFCQFLTSGLWGGLSDRIGRRPVLLMGLVGNTICAVLFGFSHNLSFAIAVRGINGLINGNFGVLRVYVREISDKTNQAQCFSLFGFFTGISAIVGPMIGGLMANPSEQFPSIFSPGSIWDEKPYLLPCLFSSFISFLALLNAFFFLVETKGKVALEDEEDAPLLKLKEEDSEAVTGPVVSCETSSRKDEALMPTLRDVLLAKDVLLNIVIYGILSYLIITLDNIFPVWSVYSVEKHGLGFDSKDIFYFVSIAGGSLVIFQMFIFSAAERKLGATMMFRIASIGIGIYAFSLPFMSHLAEGNQYLFWGLLFCLQMFGRAFCVISLFTTNAILANNSTDYYLGTVNGVMASIGALARSFGPFLGGWLLTVSMKSTLSFPFDFHLLYNWLALVAVIMFSVSLILRSSLDTVYTATKIDEEAPAGRAPCCCSSLKCLRERCMAECIARQSSFS